MRFPRRACSTGVLFASALLGGCGTTMYTPRPSPRIQVVPDGSQIALVKNGHRFGTGVLGGAVEEAVEGNPEAEEEARTYRQRGIAGFVLSTVGSVTAGVGAGLLVGNELQQNPSSTLNIASIAMTIGGAVVSIVGSFLVGSAQPHLWNAINIYNDGLPGAYPVWAPRPAYPGYPAAPNVGPGPVPLPLTPGPVPLPPPSAPPAHGPPPPAPPAQPPAYAPPPPAPPHPLPLADPRTPRGTPGRDSSAPP